MARPRNKYTGIALLHVLENNGRPILYSDLVNLVSEHVPDDIAFELRMRKLRTNPSETTAETIAKGKKNGAQQALAQLFHYRRLRYSRLPNEDRIVFLGEPPLTSEEPEDLSTDWDIERRKLQARFDHYLHPTTHDPEE